MAMPAGRKIKVLHIITGLSTGGAEMMLYRLLAALKGSDLEPVVLSLTTVGPVGEKIKDLGIPVYSLGMGKRFRDAALFFKLVKLVKKHDPDLVQTWMYHADLVGGLAAKIAGYNNVLWGIRNNNLELDAVRVSTIWTAKLCAKLSSLFPNKIIC